MPDYVIHIGPPKTASTLLQRGFAALRVPDLAWPAGLGAPGHADLPRLLRTPTALAPLFASLAAGPARRVLLSAEDLAARAPAPVAALRALIGDHPVTIVYYCRSWADLLRSRWGERVKHGEVATLAQYCAAALARPHASGAINYQRALDRWGTVFGKNALALVSLEALTAAGADPLAHFCRTFLHIDTGTVSASCARVNRSLPLIHTELLRALNQAALDLHGAVPAGLRRAFLRQPDTPGLAVTRRAIEADLVEVVVDETAPALDRLHTALWREHGAQLVPPSPADRFFTPRRAVWQAASGAFQALPEVQRELRDYTQSRR